MKKMSMFVSLTFIVIFVMTHLTFAEIFDSADFESGNITGDDAFISLHNSGGTGMGTISIDSGVGVYNGNYGAKIVWNTEETDSTHGNMIWTGDLYEGYMRAYFKFPVGFKWLSGQQKKHIYAHAKECTGDPCSWLVSLYGNARHASLDVEYSYATPLLTVKEEPGVVCHVHMNYDYATQTKDTTPGETIAEDVNKFKFEANGKWYCLEIYWKHTDPYHFTMWVGKEDDDFDMRKIMDYSAGEVSCARDGDIFGLVTGYVNDLEIWGPVNGGVPQDQTEYVDEIVVSDEYIYPITGPPAPPKKLRIVE